MGKIAYKLFKIKKDGNLYPLYIETNRAIPMNKWISANAGEMTPNGKVKSKLGELAYRPGFHSTIIPLADHIGKRQPDGSLYQAKDTVWCEVEFIDVDYTPFVRQCASNLRDACMKTIPHNGYYCYTTNANAKVQWFISGELKVNRILTYEEVTAICHDYGFEPQPLEK